MSTRQIIGAVLLVAVGVALILAIVRRESGVAIGLIVAAMAIVIVFLGLPG